MSATLPATRHFADRKAFNRLLLRVLAPSCVLLLAPVCATAGDVRYANYTVETATAALTESEPATPSEPITLCAARGCDNACPCGAAVGGWSDGSATWYGSAEALFLRRDNQSLDQAIILNGVSSQTLFSTGNLNYDTETGVRFLLGRVLNDRVSVEGSYFGIYEWGDAATVVGSDDLRLPGDIALATFDFLDADVMRVRAESEIHSVETSVVRTLDQVDLLVGFRYFQFDDDLNINAQDFESGISDYAIGARNSLYGGQVGARLRHGNELVALHCTTKAGVYGVDAQQSSFLGDFNNTFVLRNTRATGSDVAFLGEVNLDLALALTSNVRLVAGYNLIWVEGVALAGDQFDFTDTPASGAGLNHAGGVFFYGANVGLDASW